MSPSPPYIGVTGIVSGAEAKGVLRIYRDVLADNNEGFQYMIGMLYSVPVTEEEGIEFNVNGHELHPKRYPDQQNMVDAFQALASDDLALGTIHFETAKPSQLYNQISSLLNSYLKPAFESGGVRAVQINLPAPDVQQLTQIKTDFPKLKIIFQLRDAALEMSEEDLVNFLAPYAGASLIDYLLIDPSCGRGVVVDASTTVGRIYKPLSVAYPNLRLGFAGGLRPDNTAGVVGGLVAAVRGLGLEGPGNHFAVDVESGVRTDDALDISKVMAYLQEAWGAVKGSK